MRIDWSFVLRNTLKVFLFWAIVPILMFYVIFIKSMSWFDRFSEWLWNDECTSLTISTSIGLYFVYLLAGVILLSGLWVFLFGG